MHIVRHAGDVKFRRPMVRPVRPAALGILLALPLLSALAGLSLIHI